MFSSLKSNLSIFVAKIQARMPKLDTSKLLEVIADLPERRAQTRESGKCPLKFLRYSLYFTRRCLVALGQTREYILRLKHFRYYFHEKMY